jgi:hypothetical protein
MFPDHDKGNIMPILDQYSYKYSTEAGRASVRLAILKLSEGTSKSCASWHTLPT